jgi:hypothetical protein
MAGSAALPAMGEGHDAAARRARGEGRGRTDEQPCYFGRRADKHTREWKFVLFSLTEMGPFMWSRVRTWVTDETSMLDHYRSRKSFSISKSNKNDQFFLKKCVSLLANNIYFYIKLNFTDEDCRSDTRTRNAHKRHSDQTQAETFNAFLLHCLLALLLSVLLLNSWWQLNQRGLEGQRKQTTTLTFMMVLLHLRT